MLEWKEHPRAPDSEARDEGTSHFHSTASISAMGGAFHFSAPWIPFSKLGDSIYLWAEDYRSLPKASADVLYSLEMPVYCAQEWVTSKLDRHICQGQSKMPPGRRWEARASWAFLTGHISSSDLVKDHFEAFRTALLWKKTQRSGRAANAVINGHLPQEPANG